MNENKKIIECKCNFYRNIIKVLETKNKEPIEDINKSLTSYKNHYNYLISILENKIKDNKDKLENLKEKNNTLKKLKDCKSFLYIPYKKEVNLLGKEKDIINKIEKLELKINAINIRISKLQKVYEQFIDQLEKDSFFTKEVKKNEKNRKTNK